jgi:methylglyoxal synthase
MEIGIYDFFLATQPTGDCLKKKKEEKLKNFFISASTRGETGGQQQVSALLEKERLSILPCRAC